MAKVLRGKVVSVKMQNTAVVIVERRKTHPLYKKSFLRTKKYLVDDQFNVSLGDVVIFEKCAPISKMKHFKVTKVLGQDIVSLEQAQLQEKAEEAIAEVMPEEKEEVAEETESNKVEEVEAKKEKKEPKAKKGANK